MADNPFRIGVPVAGAHFTDRAEEVARVTAVLREPGARLLVAGERRIGKTSVLLRAVARVQKGGGHAFLVDCGTASAPVEVANRILTAAARAIGRDWGATATELARRVRGKITLGTEPSTGLPSVSFEPTFAPDAGSQQQALADVLDALDARAKRERTVIGIVLDEFQRLTAVLGGESGEWALRGLLQHHQHLAYVLAGSEPTLLMAMRGHGRAFYDQLSLLTMGPIDATHLARWIDERAAVAGVRAPDLGATCIQLAGPRTRDVAQLARAAFAHGANGRSAARGSRSGAAERGAFAARLAETGYIDVVAEQADPFRALWDGLARTRQQALRGIAVGDVGLSTEEARRRFGLGSSSTMARAVTALLEARSIVPARELTAGYAFDNPFFRGWVVAHTLPDLGIALPITHLPTTRAEPRGTATRKSPYPAS